MRGAADTARRLEQTLRRQHGVILASAAIVRRPTYLGRGILGENSSYAGADARGYVPVERWIMSACEAENPVRMPGEGLTRLVCGGGESCNLREALTHGATTLLEGYASRWPLTKILDIGGEPVRPDFGGPAEVPPIPVHVHGGYVVNGRIVGPGKTEAYFIPPMPEGLPPPADSPVTRLGVKPGVRKEDVAATVRRFGQSDAMYELLNPFPLEPYDGWTIPHRIIHSPGPMVTLEIQTPQDDFNLLSWQLGQRLDEEKRNAQYRSLVLRGLRDEDQLIEEGVDWEESACEGFKERHYNPARPLTANGRTRSSRIFFDPFYGEVVEVAPGGTFDLPADERPWAGVIWSGTGEVNGLPVRAGAEDASEFLAAPKAAVSLVNPEAETLTIFRIFPIAGKV